MGDLSDVRQDGTVGDARKYVYTDAAGRQHRILVTNADIAFHGSASLPLERHIARIDASLKRPTNWVV